MQVTIQKGRASGCVAAPPSKSMAHRLLICAAMSEGESVVRGISDCEDVCATLDCLRALGVVCEVVGDTVKVIGRDPRSFSPAMPLCCRESGSTLRFMIPVACLSGNEVTLHGAPSLMKRPMNIYETLCREKGISFLQAGQDITVKGPLPAGDYSVVGNISSQFISGLLFALPVLNGDSRIHITPPVESRSYIDLTLSALQTFGVQVEWENDHTLFICGGQRYRAGDVTVEGDYSNAAFLEAFSLFGGDVTVTGLSDVSLQGDRVYRAYYAALCNGAPTLDIGNCPDLGPVLFAVAAAKHGGIFTGTRRLRIKESDRAATMAEELRKFGSEVEIGEDTVTVMPAAFHAPTEILEGHNDHRVVMSMGVLCSLTGGTIRGAEAVQKSFPDFFDRIRAIGLEVCEEA